MNNPPLLESPKTSWLQALFKPQAEEVSNKNALCDKRVWILGDSFTEGLNPFIQAVFREVHYKGHYEKKMGSVLQELSETNAPPDLILVVHVERSF